MLKQKKRSIVCHSNSNLAIILSLVLTPEKNEVFKKQSINEAIEISQVRLVSTDLPTEEIFSFKSKV